MKRALIVSAFLLTSFSTAASATPRCTVLRTYLDNAPVTWMWRAASVEYANYCL
jgi:hypothetical protein